MTAVVASAIGGAALPVGAWTPAELSRGHADLAVDYEDGAFEAHVHDEERDVEYEPGEVTVFAPQRARVTVPSDPAFGFLGAPGTRVWVLPQTEDERLVHLGVSTDDLEPADWVGAEITWTLEDVDGPGAFARYTTDGFGNPTVIFDSDDPAPNTEDLPIPAHTHANWAFSAPGHYEVTVRYHGVHVVDGPVTEEVTYHFHVRNRPSWSATVGEGFSDQVTPFSWGSAPFAYALVGGALPPGLSLNPATGEVSGTPSVAGRFTAKVRVTDASSPPQRVTRPVRVTVVPGADS